MELKALYQRSVRLVTPQAHRTQSFKTRAAPSLVASVPAQPAVEAPLADSSNEYTGAGGAFGHGPLPHDIKAPQKRPGPDAPATRRTAETTPQTKPPKLPQQR